MHRLVAATALVVHMVFVAFAVVGGFLAWIFPWLLMPHVTAALWSGRMAASTKARCPLSRMENWGRSGAGRPPMHERGFIAHYFEDRVYPQRWTRRVQAVVLALVVGSWLGFTVR